MYLLLDRMSGLTTSIYPITREHPIGTRGHAFTVNWGSVYKYVPQMESLIFDLKFLGSGAFILPIRSNTILFASATGLRELLLACEKYSKEHAIIYNSKKSGVLICKNRATLHVPSPSFAVNDIAICGVAKVKYLGHVITNDMTDDADMMRQRRQLYALGNVLSRRFHMCSIEVKNTLFRSFCTPMYTCQLWWNVSVQSMQQLNVAYNNAFRFMHHLPTYCSASSMFVVNRVPNCRAVIRNRIYGFMKRLVFSSNALVHSTVTSDARFRSRIVRHWLQSLYIHVDAG